MRLGRVKENCPVALTIGRAENNNISSPYRTAAIGDNAPQHTTYQHANRVENVKERIPTKKDAKLN